MYRYRHRLMYRHRHRLMYRYRHRLVYRCRYSYRYKHRLMYGHRHRLMYRYRDMVQSRTVLMLNSLLELFLPVHFGVRQDFARLFLSFLTHSLRDR